MRTRPQLSLNCRSTIQGYWMVPFITSLLGIGPALGAEPVDFQRQVRPILAEHCFQCHGPDEGARQAALRLDLRDAALKGGDSGEAALAPGRPDASELLRRLQSTDPNEVMPPPKAKKPIRPADAEILRRWVAEGATYAQHWAFEPPQAMVPKLPGHPVDAMVAARLKEEQLELSPGATSEQLCRRLYLDLIGLPPSPRDVDDFVRASIESRPAAVDALVTRLLASEHYGEKWARHWLDVARYSDSNGYEKDLPREQWAWRDWVIRALNRDLPYNEFLIQQIAGDILAKCDLTLNILNGDLNDNLESRTRRQDLVVASGFLRNGMVNEEGAIVPEQFRMEGMFDRMDCVGKAALGLSLQCAQCHSHKFDPLSHDEYFGIFAFLNDTHEAQSWVFTPEQLQKIGEIATALQAADARLKQREPNWEQMLAEWARQQRETATKWDVVDTTEQTWVGGLNHPQELADHSVLVLGHPSTSGDMYLIAPLPGDETSTPVTGLRLEALRHGDLPFGGPGRSKWGTFAITELKVEIQLPGSESKWEAVALGEPTADFSETDHEIEDFFRDAGRDKDRKRRVGPVAFLTDGKDDTAWRADRGPIRRHTESAAVIPFAQPKAYPAGTQLKVSLVFHHGGSGNGRDNVQLGRMRLGLTTAPNPRAPSYDHAATLALAEPVSKAAVQADILFNAWRQGTAEFRELNDEIASLWRQLPEAETSVLHLAERQAIDPRPTHLLDRGGWDKPTHRVAPGVPSVLHPLQRAAGIEHPPTRLDFARWLADERSPLTARVQVNRVWQAIFGIGLVETPEDFGTRAPQPVHRDLLDWLAVDFMRHGWSQKYLVRQILTSATYQQSSHVTPVLLERDPQNRLLARGPRFRTEAEVVRDIALTVSGLLTPRVGGPSLFPPVPPSVLEYNYFKPAYWIPATGPERYRRALYVFRKRSMPDPALSSFDAPNSDFACARRIRSNTPLAALVSLNEPIFVEAAQALALRILREGGSDDAARADYAFRLCTGRAPHAAEREEVLSLLRSRRQRIADGWLNPREIATGDASRLPTLPANATPQDAAAWTILSRVLLNLDETISKE